MEGCFCIYARKIWYFGFSGFFVFGELGSKVFLANQRLISHIEQFSGNLCGSRLLCFMPARKAPRNPRRLNWPPSYNYRQAFGVDYIFVLLRWAAAYTSQTENGKAMLFCKILSQTAWTISERKIWIICKLYCCNVDSTGNTSYNNKKYIWGKELNWNYGRRRQ